MEYLTYAAALFKKGGLVMYPLLICSVITAAIAIERYLYLRSAKTDVGALLPKIEDDLKNGDWKAASKTSATAKGAAAAMLSQVLANHVRDSNRLEQMFDAAAARLVSRLRYRVGYLDTIVTLAPLLGLLGTVNGMIQSFSILNVVSGQPLAITGGIGEALIATAAGLCVAIAALIFHSYLNHCIENIITDMEDAANAVVIIVAGRDGEKYEA